MSMKNGLIAFNAMYFERLLTTIVGTIFVSCFMVLPALAGGDEIKVRKLWLLDQIRSEFIDREHPKFKSYDVLGMSAKNGCGPPEYADYMSKVLEFNVNQPNAVERPEIFALPPLVRYLYQFGYCLSDAQKKHIEILLSKKQDLFDHGTLNHAVLQSTSWYLLAQYFPNVRWRHLDNRTYSSAELMREHKVLLFRRAIKFRLSGHYEQLSPTYAMVNLFPMLNLIDFAIDEKVRNLATNEATYEVALLRLHSFGGVIVPPFTRRNYQQHAGPSTSSKFFPAISQHILWYYYGEPSLDVLDIYNRLEPIYVIMLALSNWRPPVAVLNLPPQEAFPYQIGILTPSFSQWDDPTLPEIVGKATISNNFAIGAGNLIFDPAGYNEDTQQFGILLKSKNIDNQIECFHPYWRGNLDENAWSRDRSSPFMQSWLERKQGVLLFNIPEQDPWVYLDSNKFFLLRKKRAHSLHQFAQCRIPAAFETVVFEGNWIFVKEGNVFVGLFTLGAIPETISDSVEPSLSGFFIAKFRGSRFAIYFRVAEESADLDFELFKYELKRNLPRFDGGVVMASFYTEDNVPVSISFRHDPDLIKNRIASIPHVVIGNESVSKLSENIIPKNYVIFKDGRFFY